MKLDSKPLLAKAAILLSCVLFAATVVLVKFTLMLLKPDALNGVFISFVRFLVGTLWCLVVMASIRGGFQFHDKGMLAVRGLTGSIHMVLFYIAIQVNSSGRALLLTDTYPIFVAVFGFLFFHEKLKLNQIISLPLAVAGALFVFYDHSSYRISGDIMALLSAAFAGIAIHYIKKCRERNSPMVVYLASCVFGVALSLIPAAMVLPAIMKQMTPLLVILLVAIGTLVFLGQQFMTFGFKYVSATTGSILCLSEILLTILASTLFLDEKITFRFLMGGVLLIMALALALFERKARDVSTGLRERAAQ